VFQNDVLLGNFGNLATMCERSSTMVGKVWAQSQTMFRIICPYTSLSHEKLMRVVVLRVYLTIIANQIFISAGT
jgi:hypothetical protein